MNATTSLQYVAHHFFWNAFQGANCSARWSCRIWIWRCLEGSQWSMALCGFCCCLGGFFFRSKCSILGWWRVMICTFVRCFISMICFLLTRPCFFPLELVKTPEGWWTCLSSRPLIESFGICWVSTVRDMPSSQTIHAPEKEKWAINFGSWILVQWCCKKRVSGWRCIHLACTLVATTC